jgi:hypothetical protein
MKTTQLKFAKTKFAFAALTLISLLIAGACKKEDPTPDEPGNEEELITTCKLIFTDSLQKQTTYFFKDPDGDGGALPFYGPDASSQSDSVIRLQANQQYDLEIILLDESKNPASNISTEVAEESKEHLIFFNPSTAIVLNDHPDFKLELPDSKMQITYLDKDNGSPVRALGLKTKWRTKGSGTFPINIVLKHQPDSKNGSFAPGETDLSVNFKYRIQ